MVKGVNSIGREDWHDRCRESRNPVRISMAPSEQDILREIQDRGILLEIRRNSVPQNIFQEPCPHRVGDDCLADER